MELLGGVSQQLLHVGLQRRDLTFGIGDDVVKSLLRGRLCRTGLLVDKRLQSS